MKMNKKNKKAAMEMSMGTIVTIILLVVVLVLGVFFIQRIFGAGSTAIDQIDKQVQNEINKLFTEEGKKVVIYPPSREITMKKGDSGGFGFSIKNSGSSAATFSYKVEASEVNSECELSIPEATDLISLGRVGENYELGSGDTLENAILVKYTIPEDTPLCQIRYMLNVYKDNDPYDSLSVDLYIK